MPLILAAILAMQEESELEKLRKENAMLRAKVAAIEALERVGRSATEAKVTAVSDEHGLVVISLGSEQGVKEGSTWTICRPETGEFVATITMKRVDRQWSAGGVEKKLSEPRIGDRVVSTKVQPIRPADPLSNEASSELRRPGTSAPRTEGLGASASRNHGASGGRASSPAAAPGPSEPVLRSADAPSTDGRNAP